MSNKAYYFGDANAIARLMKKMYFGMETEVPIYEEHEVTTTKQLSVANLGDFFDVTTNTPTTDPWTFADTGTAEVRMAGIKKGKTKHYLTLTAKRALTGVAVDAEYYFSDMSGNLSISIANTTALSKSFSSEDKAKMNYWTGTLAAGETIQISGNYMRSSTSATPLVSVYVTCDGISITTIEQVQVGTENKELARKVIRAYQPDTNGKAQLWFDADAAGISVTFSGTHTISDITIDGKAYQLMTITGSGTLTVKGGEVQYWMCGGGAGGGAYTSDKRAGGGGGYVSNGSMPIGTYIITIGAGGEALKNGGSTSAGTYTADGGNGRNGGSGGGGGGAGAGISTYPFGLTDLRAHCPGGGSGAGGGYTNSSGDALYIVGVNGGTNGGNGDAFQTTSHVGNRYNIGGTGGEYGGGKGSSYKGTGGTAATFYGGGGGGCGLNRKTNTIYGSGAAGYQGVAYVLVPAS